MTDEKKEATEAFGKALMEGMLVTIGKWITIIVIAVAVGVAVVDYFRLGFDDTDNLATGKRSNMALRTDYGTGCQYLESSDGELTPRLDRNGKQFC
jgi:hypothetical protein